MADVVSNWVTGITGSGGTAGNVAVAAGTTLKQTQSGSSDLYPLVIQPTTSGAAPFMIHLHTAVFNSTDDNTCAWGYNADNAVTGEPTAIWNIEPNYHASTTPSNVYQLEHYASCQMPGVGCAVRPMGYVLDRTTGVVTPSVCFAGDGFQINGSSTVGGVTINGVPNQFPQQVKFTDGGLQIFPTSWVMNAINGSFVLETLTTWELLAQGAGSTSTLFGDYIVFGDHSQNNRCQFDLVNNTFVPWSNNTGKLGTDANRWSEVHATSHFVGSAKISSGTGSPNSAVTGNVGDMFIRTDGGAGTTLYVKESGTGNTGWVGK